MDYSSEKMSTLNVIDSADKYTASIEFSNACREFYMNRVKATESFKKQMQQTEDAKNEQRDLEKPRKPSSIENAMEKLRSEMASLMDQDLCLMRQLLTLNETIEDIKTKRMYGMSKNSLCASSGKLSESDWSMSETDMFSPDDEELCNKPVIKVPKDSKKQQRLSDSLQQNKLSLNNENIHEKSRFVDTEILVNGKTIHVVHGAQSSIDSGYDETDSYQTDIEITL